MKKTNIIEKSAIVFLVLFSLFVMLSSFADAIVRPDHVTVTEYGGGILAVGAIFILIYLLCSRLPEKHLKIVFRLSAILIFTGYIIEIIALQLQPKVDLSHIIEQSLDMLEKGTHEFTDKKYFSFYSNNISIAIIIYWVFYLGKLILGEAFNYSIVGGVFNVIMIWIGFGCFFRLVDKLTRNYRAAFFCKMTMICNPVFFVYASYYYTDTVAIPVSIATVLLAVTAYQSSGSRKYLYMFASGSLFAIAVKVRIVMLMILIAIAVGMIYRKLWKPLLRLTIVFGAAFLTVGLLYGAVYRYQVKFDTTEQSVPLTHYLMMGSHGNGTYDEEDVKYTKSFKNPAERKQKNLEVYRRNLIKNGLVGNVKLLLKKEAVWGIGTRGYFQYIQNVKDETFLYQLIAGKYCGVTKGILQAYNLAIMLLVCVGLFFSRKELSLFQLILMIYWGGTILFTALWEAHPRHIMSYLPFIMLIGLPFMEVLFREKE